MALKDILERISRESDAEAEQVRNDAQALAETTRREAEKQREQIVAELRARAEERAENEKLRRLNMVNLENRRRILAERQKAIDEVFAEVKKRIQNLTGKDFASFAVSLLSRADLDGDEKIIAAKGQRDKYTSEVLSAMNQSLGDRGNLTLADEEGEFEAGFVLRKGPRIDDLGLGRILSTQREELEPELVPILFAEGEGKEK